MVIGSEHIYFNFINILKAKQNYQISKAFARKKNQKKDIGLIKKVLVINILSEMSLFHSLTLACFLISEIK